MPTPADLRDTRRRALLSRLSEVEARHLARAGTDLSMRHAMLSDPKWQASVAEFMRQQGHPADDAYPTPGHQLLDIIGALSDPRAMNQDRLPFEPRVTEEAWHKAIADRFNGTPEEVARLRTTGQMIRAHDEIQRRLGEKDVAETMHEARSGSMYRFENKAAREDAEDREDLRETIRAALPAHGRIEVHGKARPRERVADDMRADVIATLVETGAMSHAQAQARYEFEGAGAERLNERIHDAESEVGALQAQIVADREDDPTSDQGGAP